MGKEDTRITFKVSDALHKKAEDMPWGIRSEILRILLVRVIEAAEKHGKMLYGAILDGQFDITFKKKAKKK